MWSSTVQQMIRLYLAGLGNVYKQLKLYKMIETWILQFENYLENRIKKKKIRKLDKELEDLSWNMQFDYKKGMERIYEEKQEERMFLSFGVW